MKKYLDIILFIVILIAIAACLMIYVSQSSRFSSYTYLCTQGGHDNAWAIRGTATLVVSFFLSFYYLKKNKQSTDGDALFFSMFITLPLLIIADYSYQIVNLWNIDYTQERTVIADKYTYETRGQSPSTIYSIQYFSPKNDSICRSRISGMTGLGPEEARIWNSLNIGDSLCINHYQGRFWNVSKVYAVKENGREPPE